MECLGNHGLIVGTLTILFLIICRNYEEIEKLSHYTIFNHYGRKRMKLRE